MISSWPPHCHTCGFGRGGDEGRNLNNDSNNNNNDDDRDTTDTDPEGHLHILTPPDLHLVVVRSNVFKVLFGDGEEAAGEGGSPGDC